MMSTIRDSMVQYVAVRRALGSSFHEPALALDHFVDLLEREGSEFITTDLALRWAMEPKHVEHATWGRRLSQVRGFAKWLNAADIRNEIPQSDSWIHVSAAMRRTSIPNRRLNCSWAKPLNCIRVRACGRRPIRR